MAKQLSMDKAFIKKLNKILKTNLENENFGVSELSVEIGYSRSQLHRKLNEINGKSSSQFIREYRLEKSMEMLKKNQFTVSETAYRVGFSSPTYFNTCFHNFYGYPPGEVKNQKAIALPKKTYPKKIIAIVPVLILVALIIFNETTNKNNVFDENLKKSIAVLPFVNNSPNEENMYFCNGIIAGIRNHLSKIPEFTVVSRRSVEKYRNSKTPLKTIAKALDVNYIIEGHVQRIEDRAIISAELIRVGDNKILWSESYNRDVSEIFTVQTNVIQSITNNLETIISPDLKTEIISKPTLDVLAHDHYLKGEEYRFQANRSLQKKKVWLDLLNKAELSYELAIERDSLYALPYFGLANIIFSKKSFYGLLDNTYLDKDFMEVVDKSIQLNPNLANAYLLKAAYYNRLLNQKNNAKLQLEKALELNPNSFTASFQLMRIHKGNFNYVDAIKLLNKMEKLARTKSKKQQVYHAYLYYYMHMGNYDMCEFYIKKIDEIYPNFYFSKVWFYTVSNQLDKSIKYIKDKCPKNSHMRSAQLAVAYFRKKDNDKALEYFEEWEQQVTKDGIAHDNSIFHYYSYGQALIISGQTEKGVEMFNKQAEIFEKIMNSEQFINPGVYYIAIFLYASLNQYDKCYEVINKFEEVNGWIFSHYTITAKQGIGFDVIRHDPFFRASLKRGEKQLKDLQNQIRPYLPSSPPVKKD